MIKIYDSETITEIIRKIIECEDNEIILDFPFNHPILHNYIFLKMIKAKAANKRVTIVTNDIISRNIGKPLGINYSIIKDKDFFEEKKISTNLLKHNYTFFEYLIFEIKKFFRNITNSIFGLETVKQIKYKSKYYKVQKGGPIFLLFGLLVSIGMLLFIFYFAVSKTYVEITPDINVKIKAKNITFKEHLETEEKIIPDINTVKLRKITKKINLNSIYKTTGIDYKNTERASGEVTFINELKEKQYLRPKTRILSRNGILYETLNWVNIPGAIRNGSGILIPGKVDSNIIAQIYDNKGEFTGERGNLEEKDTFIIPGLKFNQDKIYAVTKGLITGGDNNYVNIISKEDIKNSNEIFLKKLKAEALNTIKKSIKEENKINDVSYEILGVNEIIKYTNENIKIIGDLNEGDKVDEFKLTGSIDITTYVYNKESVIQSLKTLIKSNILEGTEKLMFIDNKSIRFSSIISRKEEPTLEIKATTEIKVGIAYDFDNSMNTYINKLKSIIAGLDLNEATNILLNETKISNVKITNSPFFLKYVTKRIDNIIFKINEN